MLGVGVSELVVIHLIKEHYKKNSIKTGMTQSTLFTQKEIQSYFGHRSCAATSKYYDFALNDTSKNAPKMDKDLGNKLLNLEKIG